MKCCLVLLLFASMAVLADDQEVEEFRNGQNVFTSALYQEVLKINKENFLLSPLSAETVLALTQSGAKDETAAEMRNALSLPSTSEKTEKVFSGLLPTLKGNEHYALHTANKIYVKTNFSIHDSFKDVAVKVYQAAIENINFEANVEAAKSINNWVESQTNNKIKNLISPDSLDGSTRLVLINALYFKGKWANPFDKYATRKRDFYKTPTETVEVDTMDVTDYFNYYEDAELDAKLLELPYEGNDASMVIVLPNKKDGLAKVESQLQKALTKPQWKSENVHVQMPKFTIESSIELKPILANLGMKKAFGGEADFSGIAGAKGDLVIDKVIQKTFINVTEDGTEAAAATAVISVDRIGLFSLDGDQEFHVDHPFLIYLIINNAKLFIARVVNV